MTHAPHSPLERFLFWEQQIPDEVFLRQPIERNWHSWTWRQAGNECRRIAAGIQALGLQQGDRVAILSKNCAQWILADIAIMMAGCISVPLYPTLTALSIRNILEHSGARAIFLGKLDDYSQQQPGLPETILRISVSAYGISTPVNWEGLLRDYPPLSSLHTWDPEEILTIVYTSGTTGAAKGVMHKACTFGIVLEKVMHYI
ncbi:MAG: AMP-binding protein, partial [Chitinophagaceae bacterium]